MAKTIALLLVLILFVFITGMCLYTLYRQVRRENDLDILELRDAADACEQAADRLEKTRSNIL